MGNLDAPTNGLIDLRIRVHQGPAAGQEYRVSRYPVTIGRGQDCDVRLDDQPDQPTISRHHVRLLLEGGRVALQDLSTNGTWVDTRQLRRDETVFLSGGEPVWLGSETLLTIEVLPSEVLHLSTSHPAAVAPGPVVHPHTSIRPPPHRRDSGTPPDHPLTLDLETLGHFRVSVNGQAIPEAAWSSRKATVLLVYLAEHASQSLSMEKLLEDLWSDAAGTRQALQTAASRVRQALRSGHKDLPDPLRFSYNQYALSDRLDLTYDAHSFESGCKAARGLWIEGHLDTARQTLATALETYRGVFLPGASEDWVVRRRGHLEQTWAEATLALALLRERQGDVTAALSLFRAALVKDAARETAHVGVIRCLARQGSRDEALRQYHASVGDLRRLLDVGPGRWLIELREVLMGGQPLPEADADLVGDWPA